MIVQLLAIFLGASQPAQWDVVAAGAVGDAKTDNTLVFQRLLDEAGSAGGGVVNVPSGHFRIDGTLKIPESVTLQGVFRVPPSDKGGGWANLSGSVLLAYSGRGNPEGQPFIRLDGSMATMAGLFITYPEWKQTEVPPVPYPPTVFAQNVVNIGIIDCCFMNSYEAIRFLDAARFLVRNVCGYPSYRAFYTDRCFDIGKVENCHFWPFGVAYNPEDPYCKWVNTQGVAFEFGRTDWQYVLNTFCFGYGVGYKFSDAGSGGCNGNFVGIGADCCRRAILVEESQFPGLLITNGELVGRWSSEDSVCIEIAETAKEGKVSLTNCSFWGPIDRCVWLRSPKTQFTANTCNFVNWDNKLAGAPAIQLDVGKAIVQGNTFGDGDTHIRVGQDVASAIIMGNQAEGGLVIDNQAGDRTQIVANEAGRLKWEKKALCHYRIEIGAQGDRPFLREWHGAEKSGGGQDGAGSMRWSSGKSILRLPVTPNKAYELTLDLRVPAYAIAPSAGIYLGETRIAEFPSQEGPALVHATLPPVDKDRAVVTVRANPWRPKEVQAGSTDDRTLGISLHAVTMKAKRAGARIFNANTQAWIE